MARPFDAPLSTSNASTFAPTSLAAARAWESSTEGASYPASIKYDDAGHVIGLSNSSVKSSKKNPNLRLKTSTSYGALVAARAAPTHGRLHKRNRSASETTSPVTPTFTLQLPSTLALQEPTDSSLIRADPDPMAVSKSLSKSTAKIKPFLRKASSHKQNKVDLSLSTEENEGLGVHVSSESTENWKARSDAGFHHRAPSGNSLISTNTASSHHRYGTQYTQPFKQIPQPYTPPLPSSFNNSLESSSTGGINAAASDAHHFDSNPYHNIAPVPYAPLPSPRRLPPPLHIRTSSNQRLASSSQTNLPGTPSSLRQQTEHSQSPATRNPSTRTSFDSIFRKRSRANTLDDPVIKAARIAQARQEFAQREEMKERKLEQRRDKEARKQQKRSESQQRKSESRASKRAQSNAPSEKSTLRGFDAQGNPVYDSTSTKPRVIKPVTTRHDTFKGGSKTAKNQWILFWIWVRTLILKIKRKTGKSY
ncbi:MAG: hypothetical protein Q9167_004705 [Letrouitia subvulpina]